MGFYVTGNRGTVRGAARCNPVDACVKLYKGMKGLGTDEEAIIAVVGSHNMKQRQQIRKKYIQVYKKDLLKELNGELSFALAKLVAAMMMDPEEYILDSIYRAVVPQSMGGKLVKRLSGLFKDGLGKTEYSLMSMVFPRSNKQLEQIKEAFLKKYETDMEERIASGGNDLPQDFCTLLLEIISGDRVEEEEGDVDLEEVEEDVDVLVEGEAWEEPFQVIMQERSFPHLRKVLEMYKKETGRVLDALVDESDQLSLELKETYKGLLLLIRSEPEFYADRLKHAIQGAGTDDETLIRVVVLRSEIDLIDIMSVYKKKYDISLIEDVEGDTSGDYNKLLMMLLKPPMEEAKKKGEKKAKKVPRVKKEKKKKDEEDQGESSVVEEEVSVSEAEVEKKKTGRRKPKTKGKGEDEEEQGEASVVEDEDVSVSEAEVEVEKKKTVRRKPKAKGKREEEEVEAEVEEDIEVEEKKPLKRKPKVVPKSKAKKEEEEEEEAEDVVEEEEEEEVVEVKKKPVKRQPKVVKKSKAKKEEEEVDEKDVEEEEEEEVETKKPIRLKPKGVPSKVKAKKEEEEEVEEAEQEEEEVTVSKAVKGNEAGVSKKKRVNPKEDAVEVEEEEIVEVEADMEEAKPVEHSEDEESVVEEPVEAAQVEDENEIDEESASKVDPDEEDNDEDEDDTSEKKRKSNRAKEGTTTAASSDEGGDTGLVKSREL